jgi:hypothetical protein
LYKEGEGRYKRKMIKKSKQFPNASKIEELQEEHGNTMSDIRKKKYESKESTGVTRRK